jgi:hypothetical protein
MKIYLVGFSILVIILVFFLLFPRKKQVILPVNSVKSQIQSAPPSSRIIKNELERETCVVPSHRLPQCLGMEDIYMPSTGQEEANRRFVLDFMNKIVDYLYAHHMDNEQAAQVVTSWKGTVELFYKEGIVYYRDTGCLYVSRDIFEKMSRDEIEYNVISVVCPELIPLFYSIVGQHS